MIRTQYGSVLYVCAKFEADVYSFNSYKGGGSQNLEIWSRDLGHAHLGIVLRSGRSTGPSSMSVPKFEADISIRSKVIRGSQNLEIWSRDLGHAHFGIVL